MSWRCALLCGLLGAVSGLLTPAVSFVDRFVLMAAGALIMVIPT